VEKIDLSNNYIFDDVMLIDTDISNEPKLDINYNMCVVVQKQVKEVHENYYVNTVKPIELDFEYEMEEKLKKDHIRFYFSPKRMSYCEKEELKVVINELISNKIIRPSSSPYCPPIVLVKKKTGNLRLCISFKELNKISIKDRFPLPLIDDHLDMLKDKKFYTRLDLKNAFYHVKTHEDSIKYLSFITPIGQFEYMRIPFGFCNSPAIFMHYIYNIFQSIVYSNKILIYLDNILISTETVEENINILTEVFYIMSQNHLTPRLDKCSFL